MADLLHVPLRNSKGEFTDRGSRFLSFCIHADDADLMSTRVKDLRAQHGGCSHVVNAWRVGPTGDVFGYSDDGEPKGTAGRPVFEVLKGSGVTNLLIAVIRYFGGTKLGTGGLVRAYTESAKRAVSKLQTEPLIHRVPFAITVSYPLYEQVKRTLNDHESQIQGEQFEVYVNLRGVIPKEQFDQCRQDILNLSSGSVTLLNTDE